MADNKKNKDDQPETSNEEVGDVTDDELEADDDGDDGDEAEAKQGESQVQVLEVQ